MVKWWLQLQSLIQTVWCVCSHFSFSSWVHSFRGGEAKLGTTDAEGWGGCSRGKRERGGLATKGGKTHDYAVCTIKRIRLSPIFFPSTSGRLRQTKCQQNKNIKLQNRKKKQGFKKLNKKSCSPREEARRRWYRTKKKGNKSGLLSYEKTES